ncbi:MAG: hypothetical protein AAFR84_06110 [Pseudomonadota bacterium]
MPISSTIQSATRALLMGLSIAGLTLQPSVAAAGSGAVIGSVFGDLSRSFQRAVTPSVPPRVPAFKLEHRPPEYVPGEAQHWSMGRVQGAPAPRWPLQGRFNAKSADRPASGSTTDGFNHARRGN